VSSQIEILHIEAAPLEGMSRTILRSDHESAWHQTTRREL
jgi:hypothetical protein